MDNNMDALNQKCIFNSRAYDDDYWSPTTNLLTLLRQHDKLESYDGALPQTEDKSSRKCVKHKMSPPRFREN